MTKFDMHIIVPAKMVGTIIELLAGEGILVSVKPQENQSHSRVTKHHRATGSRIENGRTIILDALSSGPKTFAVLESLFASKGRATNSVSPVLSGLTAANKVTVDRIRKTVTLK